jgi:hypothetical protein
MPHRLPLLFVTVTTLLVGACASTTSQVPPSASPSAPPDRAAEAPSTIEFAGETYRVAWGGPNPAGFVREFIRPPETTSNWTKLIGIHHFPDSDNPHQAVGALARTLRAQNPDAPFAISISDDDERVAIDFITWQGDDFAEFNIFIYQRNPHGPGLIAHQFAARGYGSDMRPFVAGLRHERPRLLDAFLTTALPLFPQ